MPFWTADTATFLADFGVTAARSTFSTTALFDVEDAVADDGAGYAVQTRRQTALIKANSLGTVAQGDTVTVGGTAYNVRAVEPEPPDFVFERLILSGG